MLKERQLTTGIHSQIIKIRNKAIEIVDVGGRRTERKKWVHCQNVDRIIFVVALAGYSQTLREDNAVVSIFELRGNICTNESWDCSVTCVKI